MKDATPGKSFLEDLEKQVNGLSHTIDLMLIANTLTAVALFMAFMGIGYLLCR